MPPTNFYGLPPSWNPGYEIPDYVMAEPPGRGTMTTAWLPRGTISALVPEFQAVKTAQQILGRNDAGLGSLGDDTLGIGTGVARSTAGRDPIADYGVKAASWLMHSIKSVPSDQRTTALRAIFDAIDTSLWGKVERRATELKNAGLSAPAALQAAMAQSMSAGMLEEIAEAGRRVQRGAAYPVARHGQLALGVYPDAVPRATTYALEALGFSFSSLNPVSLVQSGASAVKDAAVAVGSGVKDAAIAVGGGVKSAATTVGGGLRNAGSAVVKFVEKGVKTLGGLACKVVGSGVGKVAATGVATVYAGPAGAVGVQAATSKCGGSGGAADVLPPPPPPRPSWVKPVAIGAGVLGVGTIVYLATRKRHR
jgi:hypothetical protein